MRLKFILINDLTCISIEIYMSQADDNSRADQFISLVTRVDNERTDNDLQLSQTRTSQLQIIRTLLRDIE
jgi:hypothetical protein